MVLALHGGAGSLPFGGISAGLEAELLEALSEIAFQGQQLLLGGASALDTVEYITRELENCPLFNAGFGAAFTKQKTHELDAAIMCGKTLNAGAVALVKHVQHPVSLARTVLERSPHVLMAGKGAELLARLHKLEMVPNTYFTTPEKQEELNRFLLHGPKAVRISKGTTGAVALDKWGNLAAATSTGGLTGKESGRIGDSPLIGAGTYADNRSCGVSCTGNGEHFIRIVAAHEIASLVRLTNCCVQSACDKVLQQLQPLGGDAGILAINHSGKISFAYNTERFYRSWASDARKIEAAIY